MSQRALLVLSILVAALAVLVVVDRPAPPADPGLRARLLPGVDAAAITRVELRTPGRPPVVLVRQEGVIMLISPVAAAIDRAAVNDLLSTIEYLAWRRRLPVADAAARGLDDGARVLVVDTAAGAHHELRLGKREPGLERAWVSDGRAHYLVDDYFVRALDRGADDLRRRDLLPAAADDAQRLIVLDGEARLVLRAATEAAAACVELPGGCARVDAGRAALLRRRVADLRAASFVTDAAAPGTTTLSVGPDVLTVDGPCPGGDASLLLARSPLGPVCLRADALAPILAAAREPQALVDRALLPWGARDVRALTIARGGDTLRLVREDGQWRAPAAAAVDTEAVDEWLLELASFAAVELRDAPAVASPPAGAATLTLEPTKGAPLVLWLEPAADRDRVLVRRPGEPLALVVHADVARFFTPLAVLFAPREILAAELTAIRAITRRVAGQPEERALRGETLDDWSLVAPVTATPDGGALAALRESLAHLHARRAVAAAPAREHGLEPPRLVVEVTIDPPPTAAGAAPGQATLAVGARTRDRECFARRTDLPAAPVVLLDADTCDALDTPLAPRTLWGPRDAASVAVGKARWERHGPGWYGPDGARLADRDAAALVESLVALGAPTDVAGYGEVAGAPLVITWADGATTELRLGRGEYGLAGAGVRYAVPKAACAGPLPLCR